ncbi:MAG: hypothetical protein ACJA0X_001501 [Cyclobacteriaceae bacterium]
MIRNIFFTIALLTGLLLQAQDDGMSSTIIQFTGVIFTQDSTSVVPGVHIYLPKNGRGTTSNPYGFFSLPVREGDSIIFSGVGLKKRSFIIPKHEEEFSLKLLLTMEEDITFLEEVEVFPYPSEAMFKEAVLSLELPYQKEFDNMNGWLAQEYMRKAYSGLSSGGSGNYDYQMYQQQRAIADKYNRPANNLLNPFAWARAIRDLKRDSK